MRAVEVEPACGGSFWRASWGDLGSSRDAGKLDEVKNLMEAEGAHVVSSRHGRIETLKGAERAKARRKKRGGSGGSSRREGASPTAVRVGLGEGKGQESIGHCSWLKTRDRVWTLGRSKALKSGPTLTGSVAARPSCRGGRGLRCDSATRPDLGTTSRSGGGGLARRGH